MTGSATSSRRPGPGRAAILVVFGISTLLAGYGLAQLDELHSKYGDPDETDKPIISESDCSITSVRDIVSLKATINCGFGEEGWERIVASFLDGLNLDEIRNGIEPTSEQLAAWEEDLGSAEAVAALLAGIGGRDAAGFAPVVARPTEIIFNAIIPHDPAPDSTNMTWVAYLPGDRPSVAAALPSPKTVEGKALMQRIRARCAVTALRDLIDSEIETNCGASDDEIREVIEEVIERSGAKDLLDLLENQAEARDEIVARLAEIADVDTALMDTLVARLQDAEAAGGDPMPLGSDEVIVDPEKATVLIGLETAANRLMESQAMVADAIGTGDERKVAEVTEVAARKVQDAAEGIGSVLGHDLAQSTEETAAATDEKDDPPNVRADCRVFATNGEISIQCGPESGELNSVIAAALEASGAGDIGESPGKDTVNDEISAELARLGPIESTSVRLGFGLPGAVTSEASRGRDFPEVADGLAAEAAVVSRMGEVAERLVWSRDRAADAAGSGNINNMEEVFETSAAELRELASDMAAEDLSPLEQAAREVARARAALENDQPMIFVTALEAAGRSLGAEWPVIAMAFNLAAADVLDDDRWHEEFRALRQPDIEPKLAVAQYRLLASEVFRNLSLDLGISSAEVLAGYGKILLDDMTLTRASAVLDDISLFVDPVGDPMRDAMILRIRSGLNLEIYERTGDRKALRKANELAEAALARAGSVDTASLPDFQESWALT